jgi:hypothetical protein
MAGAALRVSTRTRRPRRRETDSSPRTGCQDPERPIQLLHAWRCQNAQPTSQQPQTQMVHPWPSVPQKIKRAGGLHVENSLPHLPRFMSSETVQWSLDACDVRDILHLTRLRSVLFPSEESPIEASGRFLPPRRIAVGPDAPSASLHQRIRRSREATHDRRSATRTWLGTRYIPLRPRTCPSIHLSDAKDESRRDCRSSKPGLTAATIARFHGRCLG